MKKRLTKPERRAIRHNLYKNHYFDITDQLWETSIRLYNDYLNSKPELLLNKEGNVKRQYKGEATKLDILFDISLFLMGHIDKLVYQELIDDMVVMKRQVKIKKLLDE